MRRNEAISFVAEISTPRVIFTSFPLVPWHTCAHSASGCPIASRNKMRVLESGGTVEQHKAAIAAIKFEHQAAACSANGCDGVGGGAVGASGHLVNGSTFVAPAHHQRTMGGGGAAAAGITHHAGTSATMQANKKGAATTKFDEMPSIGYPKAYGGE